VVQPVLETVRAPRKGDDEEETKEVDGNSQGLVNGNGGRDVHIGNDGGQEEGETVDRARLTEENKGIQPDLVVEQAREKLLPVDLLVGRISVIQTHAFNQELHFFFSKVPKSVFGSGKIGEEEKDNDAHQDGWNTFNDEDPFPSGWEGLMSVSEEMTRDYFQNSELTMQHDREHHPYIEYQWQANRQWLLKEDLRIISSQGEKF
jgi:hypothetical protein